MPFKRYDELEQSKKENIINAAITVFAEKSFSKASINKISKDAGLSAGALYYYFEDKRDLFVTTLLYVLEQLKAKPEDLIKEFESKGYWETIKQVVTKRNALTAKNLLFSKLILRMMKSDDPEEAEYKKIYLKEMDVIFNYGRENGLIRNDLPNSFLSKIHIGMIVSVMEWTYDCFLESKDIELCEIEEVSNQAIEMIKKAMT